MARDERVEGVAARFCNYGPERHGDGCSECERIGRAIRARDRRAVRLLREAARLPLAKDESHLKGINNGMAYQRGREHVEAYATNAILGRAPKRKRRAIHTTTRRLR